MNEKEVLNKAIKLLRKKRWIQGFAFEMAGGHRTNYVWFVNTLNVEGVCMMGAIALAAGDTAENSPLCTLLSAKVAAKGFKADANAVSYPAAQWQDVKGRTKKEVIALMEEVRDSL